MNRILPSTLVLLCGALTLSACDDEASIGLSASCAFENTCESPALDETVAPIGVGTARATLTPLEPVWRRGTELGAPAGSTSLYEHRIALGAPGVLWYFSAREGGPIRLATLDDTGAITAQQDIAPPAGFRRNGRLLSASGHPLGPVVGVSWPPECSGAKPCDERTGLIVFGETPSTPPRHVTTKLPSYWQPSQAFRTRAGDALIAPNRALGGVRKLDLDGNVLWDLRFSRELLREVPGIVSTPNLNPSNPGDALSPSDDYAAGLIARTDTNREGGVGLLRVSTEGKTSLLRYGDRETDFAGGGSAIVFDPSGRLTLLHTKSDGDLTVLQLDGEHQRIVSLIREDYSALTLGPVAADAAGTVYVATRIGGRSPDAMSDALCRIKLDGEGRCFAIPERVEDLEATAPGVVFALTSTGVARFDVP